ncbi:hypothetical protein Hdeb2414_s0015g00440491 [Helianthus debilis subsp. tardiflorus]
MMAMPSFLEADAAAPMGSVFTTMISGDLHQRLGKLKLCTPGVRFNAHFRFAFEFEEGCIILK